MNFNDLPDDIKRMIFDVNRKKQIEVEKVKFRMVMSGLKNILSYNKTSLDYDEDNPIRELLWTCEEIKKQDSQNLNGMFICG